MKIEHSFTKNEDGEIVLTYKGQSFVGDKGYEKFMILYNIVANKANVSYLVFNTHNIFQGNDAVFVNEELSDHNYIATMFDIVLDSDCLNKTLNLNIPTTTV